jgi:hypothetical protein
MAQRKPDPPPPASNGSFDEGRQPGDDDYTHGGTPKPSASKALVPQTETDPGTFTDASTTIAKRGAYGDELVASRESTAVAAQVQALIAARTMHALKNPRSLADARIRILADCERPGFAKAAIFRKPIGGTHIEGLSIRFAESALRHWGNCGSESILLYDGPDKRIVRIMLGDFESNTWHSRDITIVKTVERKQLKAGQVAISQRLNSNNEIVFTVETTDDEMQTKEGAARSKVLRNEGLRLIPADILEEALTKCRKTRSTDDAKDPAAAQKAVADAFAAIGVMPSDLSEFLGCELSQISPAQLGELKEWYVAIKEGDATWKEILRAKVSDIQPSDDEKPAAVSSLLETARAKQAERKAAKK